MPVNYPFNGLGTSGLPMHRDEYDEDNDGKVDRAKYADAAGALSTPILLTGVRILAAGYLQILNTDTGLWHTITLKGAPGAEVIDISTPGTT